MRIAMKKEVKRLNLYKISKITMVAICLLSSLPQEGFCASIPIEQIAVNLVPFNPIDALPLASIQYQPIIKRIESSFADLAEVIGGSEDPLAITRKFFQIFVDQINARNGTSYTMEESCHLLRQNMNLVPLEHQEIFLIAIDAIETNNLPLINSDLPLSNLSASIYWPWHWNWFGLNKKDKKNHQDVALLAAKISAKYVIFGLIVAGIVIVAIFNPAAVGVAAKAMVEAAPLFI